MDVLKTVPHSAKEAAQMLHDALVGTGLTIATAESLTGETSGVLSAPLREPRNTTAAGLSHMRAQSRHPF